MNKIQKLIDTGKTVFDTKSIKDIFAIPTDAGLYSFLQRAKKDGRLLSPRKGIWILPQFDRYELAGVLFPGGYISLAPVLFEEGVSFQYYGSTIQSVWHKNREIIIVGIIYLKKRIAF